jgi:Na+/melibiose symporter-like transporter
VRLFRNPRFTAAAASIALAFFGLFGFIFLSTQYFQAVRGYDPLRAGLATLPFAVVTGACSPVAIALMRRLGTKVVVAAGLLMMSGGFVIVALIPEDAGYWQRIVVAMALMAAGLALTASPSTEAIMGALPADKTGAGSAVNDTTREMGGTLGVAIVGSVLNSGYSSHVTSALSALGAPHSVTSRASQSILAGLTAAARFPGAAAPAATADVKNAFMTGLHGGALVAACATLLAALVALAFLPARGH